MGAFLNAMTLMFVLLNPFLVMIYLLDAVEHLETPSFSRSVFRGAFISVMVFVVFAWVGDAIFTRIVHARFGSFQIFGGVIFLMIGIKFVFQGPTAIEILRGDAEDLSAAIAMPVLIGPGTISAAIVIGEILPPLLAGTAILLSVFLSVGILIALKMLHDKVRPRNEVVVQRAIAVTGRITSLFVGTVAIEMIMSGLMDWMGRF